MHLVPSALATGIPLVNNNRKNIYIFFALKSVYWMHSRRAWCLWVCVCVCECLCIMCTYEIWDSSTFSHSHFQSVFGGFVCISFDLCEIARRARCSDSGWPLLKLTAYHLIFHFSFARAFISANHMWTARTHIHAHTSKNYSVIVHLVLIARKFWFHVVALSRQNIRRRNYSGTKETNCIWWWMKTAN